MKTFRMLLAAVSLVAMTALFVVPTVGLSVGLGWLPRLQLVPALLSGAVLVVVAIIVSALLFGRVYCSVVCPLGIAQDIARRLARLVRFARVGERRPMERCARAVRLTVLVASVVGWCFGCVGLVEPYAVFGRFLGCGVLRTGEPSVAMIVWSLGLFAFVLTMTVFAARWWCAYVCPVGTLLGLVSRFAVYRPRVDRGRCVGCGACVKTCDRGAIVRSADGKAAVDHSLCVSCFNCVGKCGKEALRWR